MGRTACDGYRCYFHDVGFTLQRDNHEKVGRHYANLSYLKFVFS